MTMSGPILSVKFFHTEAGNEPVRDLLRDLPPEDRKIIGIDIKEVQFGWPLGMPLVRKMEKDLWEVRSHLERRIFRVLLLWLAAKWCCFMLLSRSRKVHPQSDLEIARARKNQL